MGIPFEWEHIYAINGNGNGKSTCDNGNGNGYFFMCAKIPIGRLDANASQYKNSSGDEIANVNFFYNIAHVEASAYAH